MPPKTVRMVSDTGGEPVDVPVEDLSVWSDRGYTPQSNEARASQVVEQAREEHYNDPANRVRALEAGIARGATGGLSDVVIGGLGGREDLAALQQYNSKLSLGGEIAGTLLPTGVGGLAARAGGKVAGVIRGGGAIAKIARAGATAATEGAIIGAGQGVSQLALSDDPLSVERVTSVIGQNVLLGGGTGGLIGAGGKAIGLGLARAKGALERYATRGVEAAGAIGEDIARLDAKGLTVAEKAEKASIEATRKTQRAELVDDLSAFRRELKEERKVFLATKGIKEKTLPEEAKGLLKINEIGATSLEADRAIDRLLRNPKALADDVKPALKALQQQETAFEHLQKRDPTLRQMFASDTSGERLAALDAVPEALERNRTLQAKIRDLTAAPTSPRLEQIIDARAGLTATKSTGGVMDALGAGMLGHAAGALAGIPYVGQAVVAAKMIGGVVKKLGGLSAENAARGAKAVDAFLTVGGKVARPAPVIATKVLGSVAFAPQQKRREAPSTALPDLYRERVAEVRSHVVPGPDGKLMMRPESRDQIAATLAPIRAANPLLADKIEANAANATVFLANKAPHKPEPFGMQLGGKDKWQPSDMQMRQWARYVAAVNDPYSVVERLAHGSVTPEDAETMREVYPEMYADIQRQIVEKLPTLTRQLPYQRRLALTVFSGVPVDPTMHPQVLAASQASFENEAGTEGGTQAPKASPAFGSVSKPQPTPAQERSAG